MAIFVAPRRTVLSAVPASTLVPEDGLAPGVRAIIQDAVVPVLAEENKKAAASEEAAGSTSPRLWATMTATAVFVVALLISANSLFFTESGPTFKAAEGVGVFALFYIVAQAAERLVEMVLPYLDQIPGGKRDKIADRDAKVVAASTGTTATPKSNDADKEKAPEVQAANAQARVDQAKANRTALVFGSTAAIGMLLCGYLEADFLTAVGVNFGATPNFVTELVMLGVTGLVVGGGSKALHDTISNVSKSSDKKTTPTETGGQTS